MPITLGDDTFTSAGTGPWNDYLLVIIWIAQVICSSAIIVTTPMLVLLGLYSMSGIAPFAGVVEFFACIAVMGSIFREVQLFRAQALRTDTYYRFQLMKSIFALVTFLGGVVIFGAWRSFSSILTLLIYGAPFWAAFGYSIKVRREEDGGLDSNGGIRSLW